VRMTPPCRNTPTCRTVVTCVTCTTHRRPQDVPWHQHAIGCEIRAGAVAAAGRVNREVVPRREAMDAAYGR
jgi:hypothetical protein